MAKPKYTMKYTTSEVKRMIDELGYFPTQKEISNSKYAKLNRGIQTNGGINVFRRMFGFKELQKHGYWFDETIISNIKDVITQIGHYPTQNELINLSRCDLLSAINSNGGLNHYAKILGYNIKSRVKKHKWNNDKIIDEINKFIIENKHFPKSDELVKLGRSDLVHVIHRTGGFKKYQKLLGYEQYYNDEGYWNEDNTTKELENIMKRLGYFPTYPELHDKRWCKILIGVKRNGGIHYFRKKFGITDEDFSSYKSYRSSYTNIRGKKSEGIIFDILTDYCGRMNLNLPDRNLKFPNKSFIEFVCTINKTIGIDVTNTESRHVITDKWRHKNYHNYLDYLWIVVVSDSFDKDDYSKWNQESPNNVYIMSIDTFIDELQYDLDEMTKTKIDKYKKCTFHTRDNYKKEKQEADAVSAS